MNTPTNDEDRRDQNPAPEDPDHGTPQPGAEKAPAEPNTDPEGPETPDELADEWGDQSFPASDPPGAL